MEEKKEKRGRRGGRGSIPAELRRIHSVNMRLNSAELSQLDAARGTVQRGEWMRLAGLDRLPSIVPEANRQAWADLGRLAGNLNQILARANAGYVVDAAGLVDLISGIREQIRILRADLLGQK